MRRKRRRWRQLERPARGAHQTLAFNLASKVMSDVRPAVELVQLSTVGNDIVIAYYCIHKSTTRLTRRRKESRRQIKSSSSISKELQLPKSSSIKRRPKSFNNDHRLSQFILILCSLLIGGQVLSSSSNTLQFEVAKLPPQPNGANLFNRLKREENSLELINKTVMNERDWFSAQASRHQHGNSRGKKEQLSKSQLFAQIDLMSRWTIWPTRAEWQTAANSPSMCLPDQRGHSGERQTFAQAANCANVCNRRRQFVIANRKCLIKPLFCLADCGQSGQPAEFVIVCLVGERKTTTATTTTAKTTAQRQENYLTPGESFGSPKLGLVWQNLLINSVCEASTCARQSEASSLSGSFCSALRDDMKKLPVGFLLSQHDELSGHDECRSCWLVLSQTKVEKESFFAPV